ncbi:GntR family transcriptional regulator [Nocardioides euryhalodurans]|uniref:GntR family transcriptional regulator n=1 Tax=Nocardioides euryhalodurans TaxID=2518370 RepID=A0A4P7GLZ3_9ACTN|nr:GntR family transcriptional regulator [Nocardioides euryhalodurans]QBR93136.1 GntR family transcriptional regulator [Nocardioides euryhalodurans]
MARRGDSDSLALEVYEQLRADILEQQVQPGERLKQLEIGRRLGVSAGVMREALGLLSTQGLVRLERNRGYCVTPLSEQSFAEVVEARGLVEGITLRLSVSRGDLDWESDVVAAHHRLAREPRQSAEQPDRRNPEWARAHSAFHRALLQACGNSLMLEVCERFWDSAELHRLWVADPEESERDVAGEHRALLDAALDRDAVRAERLLEEHMAMPEGFSWVGRTLG